MYRFEPFATTRVRVRRFADKDADALHAYRNDPAVNRYQLWTDQDRASIGRFVQIQAEQPVKVGMWLQLAIADKTSDALLGDVAVRLHADGDDVDTVSAEIGFSLAAAHQGKGYMTEALRGLLAYLFGLPVRRVFAQSDARNHASQRVMARAGLRPEAHFVADYWSKGEHTSSTHYGLLAHEWHYRQRAGEVYLAPITMHNWREVAKLEVHPEQQPFVAAPTYYLALCQYGHLWQAKAIVLNQDNQEQVIGMLMFAYDSDEDSVWLGGIIIDQRFQGRGYAKAVLAGAFEYLGGFYGACRNFALSYEPSNHLAKRVYAFLGFVETGEREDDEVVARLRL